jgi:alkylation response protein AidB-like acyl-CoA dehydrogenase
VQYALKRKTFGKTLISHQLIRYKLAEMVRQIEALQVRYIDCRAIVISELRRTNWFLKAISNKMLSCCPP